MMEPTDGSPPNSMYMVRCGEMFPKPAIEKEDDKLVVPFKELPGEGVRYIGETTDGLLALTNYRIFVSRRQQEKSVPLGLIDTVQSRDLIQLIVSCKDANTVRCVFETAEKCSEWQRRITAAVSSLINLNSLFAFPFYAWSSEQSELQHQRAMSSASRSSSPMSNNYNNNTNNNGNLNSLATFVTEAEWASRLRKISSQDYDEEFRKEVERLQFNMRGAWRISKVNEDFKLCPSYPRHFLVPAYITDETLQSVASFRSSRRIPVAVWRHRTTGAIIARCSQPEVGWLGWRNNKDEELLQAFVNACAFDQGEQQQQQNNQQLMVIGDGVVDWGKECGKTTVATNGGELLGDVEASVGNRLSSTSDAESVCSSTTSPEGSHEEVRMDKPKKLLIVDARSYASAVTNRARGGGCECIDYYPSAEIQFMNLANIHAVRKSFNALRQLCASPPDMGSWLSNLEKTLWLQHLSGLLAASVTVTRMIELEGRPVLVHCSDGWDRTPQIVATAQLCLDPYYRTVNGFKTLVEREWLSFGHKFGDRCGHGPNSYELNERCPVFLQWLDCVHQIHNQFPCSFEFSIGYLIKLAQHSHSGLFGTFLTNTMRERIENSIFDRTYSVWPFLSGPMYKNPLYVANRATVLWPAYNIRDLTLWNEVYLGNLHTAPTAMNTENMGTKMETMLERMDSTGGEDKLDMVMRTLSLDVGGVGDDDDDDVEGEGASGGSAVTEPLSPMSKTRSYNDLLETNGSSNGPHRRCSDPAMPLELMKQNGMHEEALRCDKVNGGGGDKSETRENGVTELVANVAEQPMQMGNGGMLMPPLKVEANDELPLQVPETNSNSMGGEGDVDSLDGSPSPTVFNAAAAQMSDVMLESVDLRSSSLMLAESHNFTRLLPETANGSCSMWHGNVETSTDTLVPTNALTDDVQLTASVTADFLTKRQENEEMRVQRTLGDIDYSENSLNLQLLNNQSLYDLTTAEVAKRDANIVNLMDMSLMDSVIQSQPLPANKRRQMTSNRHRRTPSNSKSDPSPHNMQNEIMSPSATMNSRFSTPGGRSPNLTPPEVTPVQFEKANNVILSCPDGLAHALSEKNIRLQQIIYEHTLREEALQRELNATRRALLKRICFQCNNNQEPSSNHEEQIHGLDNGENASVCSWEAVEERGDGVDTSPASMQSDHRPSQPQATTTTNSKVLWVPDHAVNHCTGCSFEFSLYRRKHHCRSCGKIFCSDCSEFYAALPEERLYNPVRLCGPCYLTVTQTQHEQHQQQRGKYQNEEEIDKVIAGQGKKTRRSSSIEAPDFRSTNSHHHDQHRPLSPCMPLTSSTALLTDSGASDSLGTGRGVGGAFGSVAPTPMLCTSSSCSVEVGEERRRAASSDLDEDGSLMCVTNGGGSVGRNGSKTVAGGGSGGGLAEDCCNLKTATASN